MTFVSVVLVLVVAGLAVVARSWALRCGEWRRVATSLARIVRALDAYPVVEHTMLEDVEVLTTAVTRDTKPGHLVRDRRFTIMPMPVSVAVVGRESSLDRWSTNAARALQAFDALEERDRS